MDNNAKVEERKKAIFDSMSQKRKEKLLKKNSYKNWNPFGEPKNPIDIRMDKNNKTPFAILDEFISFEKKNNIFFSKGGTREILKMIIGLINEDERYMTIYRFSLWYDKELSKKNIKL